MRLATAGETIRGTVQQINDKKYETELTAAGVKTIYKYGVAFSGKKVEVAVG